ncbi:MAG: TonB-dependent receptor [Alistipes sp.]|nr:TonB-dependent receptor [Alistipes sp.]MBO7285961.1 TonB-dependent receptor [Alistipes sp.]
MKKLLLSVLLLTVTFICDAANLKGIVFDASTKEPLIGVTVYVKGTTNGDATDLDGRFEISNLKDGPYTIIVSYISYTTQEIEVHVSENTPELQIGLESDNQQLDEVVVTARRNMESERVLQAERKQSTIAIENIGAKEMGIKGISNVQEGVKKITGISIAPAGQLIVRGLGDRYSITTLNGLPIASPNPDNKLIPLDLFPSSTVQNITVSKVYDVASFADYSGAHINISTKSDVPDDFLQIGLNIGGAFNTIGSTRYQMDRECTLFHTPSMDKRAIDMPLLDFDDYATKNNIFRTSFAVDKKRAMPSLGGNLGFGKNFKIAGQTLTILASANLSNDYQNIYDAFYKTLEATGNTQSDFNYDSYEQQLKIAALGYVGTTLRQNDRIGYTFFYTRDANDTYQLREGVDAEGHHLVGSNDVTHIYSLQSHQLSGLHEFLSDELELDWAASYSQTSSDEPDRRQVMYVKDGDALKLFKLNRQETMRYFGYLDEEEWNGRVSLKWRWNDKSFLKVGFNYKDKSRDYMGTRFYYNLNKINPTIANPYDTDEFLNITNIANRDIVIERKKQPKDSYLAGNRIFAGYILTDWYIMDNLLLNLGLRYEISQQWVRYASDGGDWYSRQRDLEKNDFFPAINLKYTINDAHNLRFAASRTITRPSFIEMAPFLYQESYGSAQVRGNENLQNAYNYNIDLKYEWFTQNGDMVSVTGYFKYLESPIERIQELNGGATLHSFRNAEDGVATGVEVELRKELVKGLRLGVNASYMYTNVKLPDGGAYTNKERSLQGASPILLNADLTWSHKFSNQGALNLALLYNMQGSRIYAVGVSQLGDIKQRAVHTLNFSAGYNINDRLGLKFQINDLLGSDMVYEQEVPATGQKVEVERFRRGQNFEIGINYKF